MHVQLRTSDTMFPCVKTKNMSHLCGYPALVWARHGLGGAEDDEAAVSLQGEEAGLLLVQDPGPHGDDLAGSLVRPGPDPGHAAWKCEV